MFLMPCVEFIHTLFNRAARSSAVPAQAEYDHFIRKCAKRGGMPPGLAAPFKKNKMEVFNAWLQNAKCLDRTAVALKRRVASKERVRRMLSVCSHHVVHGRN